MAHAAPDPSSTARRLPAAYDLIRSALPDLLDRTLAEPLQLRINRVLAKKFDGYDSIEWCRSRQSNSKVGIDVGLGFPADRVFGELLPSPAASSSDSRRRSR